MTLPVHQQDRTIEIGGRKVGTGQPPFVVAELSGNHNGELTRALDLLAAAKDAGADAVKLQTYRPDTITIDHVSDDFIIKGGLWGGRKLYDLYREAQTPWEWHAALFRRSRELGLIVFSAPFDPTAVDFLQSLEAPAYKIASFEAIDLPLIAKAARTGKPLIISTGMADEQEIEDAVVAARDAGCDQIALLHRVSGYPTPAEEMNLRTVGDLADRFGVVVGVSDHTLDTVSAVAAVAAGAAIVEKHLTLRRSDGGPDAGFSLEPQEFARLCADCRTAWAALGRVTYQRMPSERGNTAFRRSLYVIDTVKAGETFSERNVRSIRPGFGLPPKFLPLILGRRATRTLDRGTALSGDMIEGWDRES